MVDYIAHSPAFEDGVALLGDCDNKRLCVFDVVSNVKLYQQPQLGIRAMYLLRGCILNTPRDTATKPTDPNDSLFFEVASGCLSLRSTMLVGGWRLVTRWWVRRRKLRHALRLRRLKPKHLL